MGQEVTPTTLAVAAADTDRNTARLSDYDGTVDVHDGFEHEESVVLLATHRRALSIHTVVAGLCVVCIFLTAMSSEILHGASSDESLSATRDILDTSIHELQITAEGSLKDVSFDLLNYAQQGMKRMLYNRMKNAVTTTQALKDFVEWEFANVTKDAAFMRRMVPRVWSLVQTAHETGNVGALGVFAGPYGLALFHDGYPRLPLHEGTWPFTLMLLGPDKTVLSCTYPGTGEQILNDTATYPVMQWKHDVAKLPGVWAARLPFFPKESVHFPNVDSIGSFTGYSVTGRARDLTKSQSQVEVMNYIDLDRVGDVLEDIAKSSMSTGMQIRLWTVSTSSWMAEAMRANNMTDWEKHDQTHLLTGVSTGRATVKFRGLNFVGLPGNNYRPLMDVDATDPVISGIARAINGTYADLVGKTTPVYVTLNVTVNATLGEYKLEKHEYYTSVGRLQIPEHSLDWWFCSALDTDLIFADVKQKRLSVQHTIDTNKDEVERDTKTRSTLSKLCVAGIAVVLVVASAFTSFKILQPIKAMQESMGHVANMELESANTSETSILYEMHVMQRDFRKMVENLLEFRAYVPISVLESNGYSGEGGKEVVKPPTGNVAIVFTDIKGSTALWKSSAGDMNNAMEIHNEVMRDCCIEFNGYEVKTIGDAFMVSFRCPFAAANFALAVQTNLAKKKWPKGLELPEAGLVVRIGINYGATIAEENPVTGRVDYRGSTVNLASRVEAKAKGGTICITSDMYSAIKPDMEGLGGPAVTDHGLHDIKGLGNGHQLYLMVAAPLKRRFKDSETDTEMRDNLATPAADDRRSSNNSGDVTSLSGARAVAKNARKTGLQLQGNSATVAVCRLTDKTGDSSLLDNCNIMVRAAIEAASSTDGVIGNVTGRTLTVVWNASKKCTMHTTAALNFVSEMKKLQNIMQVGLATGTMLHGNVGTKTSRFATSFGVTLEAAEAMTDHASSFGVYCLYADCTSDKRLESDSTVRSCLRMVDAWQYRHPCKGQSITIYEVHLSSLATALQGWGGNHDEFDDHECVDLAYHTEVVKESMKSKEGLHNLIELAKSTGDRTLQHVAEIMAEDASTAGYRCFVKFSKYEKVKL